MKKLQKEIHELAKEKGWWDKPRSPLEIHMLIVSEVAEATEAARTDSAQEFTELADAVIRIMDYCEHSGVDLEGLIRSKHEVNKGRPYRHGGKKF